MNAKEMLEKLADLGVISHPELQRDGRYYVEDCESYNGCAYITFDKNGNCIKVEED